MNEPQSALLSFGNYCLFSATCKKNVYEFLGNLLHNLESSIVAEYFRRFWGCPNRDVGSGWASEVAADEELLQHLLQMAVICTTEPPEVGVAGKVVSRQPGDVLAKQDAVDGGGSEAFARLADGSDDAPCHVGNVDFLITLPTVGAMAAAVRCRGVEIFQYELSQAVVGQAVMGSVRKAS